MQKLFVVSLALFLVGCGSKREAIQHVGSITPRDTAVQGIDVYKQRRLAGEQTPDYRGDQLVTIRSIRYDKNLLPGFRKEVVGADCELSASEFSAKFKTPAKIRVPIYGYASSELVVTCSHADYEKGLATVRSLNKTKSDRLGMAQHGGLAGVLVVSLINAASDDKQHVFIYPAVDVSMKPLNDEKN